MYKSLIPALFLFASIMQSASASNEAINNHSKGIWSIANTDKEQRWIVIHNLPEARTTGIYHIEVIQKAKDAPAWKIVRLVSHMAITEAALKRSIVKPLDSGAVYPEPYDNALTQWQAQNNGKGGEVCNTTVLACIPAN